MNDDPLPRAWRAATDARSSVGATPTTAEPPATRTQTDPDEVWAAVRGELRPERAQAIVEAALVDDDALAELRIAFAIADAAGLRELAATGDASTAATAAQPVEPRVASLGPWSVAVALAAALALVWVIRPTPRVDDTGGLRDRSSGMIAAEGTDVVDRNACELRWRAQHHEGTFDLRVMTENAVVLVQARGLGAASYVVPASALLEVHSGAALLWQVDHVLPDGTRLRSPTFSSRLR